MKLSGQAARTVTVATWIQGDWAIENALHWIRDVVFDEDRHQLRTGSGPQVMAPCATPDQPAPTRQTPASPPRYDTTRMRDTAFKRVLTASPIGTELELDAPYGSFTLQHNVTRPAVFLTGGIGVTPVRSIALQANHDGTDHTIIAFCSNKRLEDSAYLQELTTLSDTSEQFTFVATMTEPDKSTQAWAGETGPIDAAMLSRYVDGSGLPSPDLLSEWPGRNGQGDARSTGSSRRRRR